MPCHVLLLALAAGTDCRNPWRKAPDRRNVLGGQRSRHGQHWTPVADDSGTGWFWGDSDAPRLVIGPTPDVECRRVRVFIQTGCAILSTEGATGLTSKVSGPYWCPR